MSEAADPTPHDGGLLPDSQGAPTPGHGYLAAEDYLDQLVAELDRVQAVHGRLVLAAGALQQPAWALNIWIAPEVIAIASIADAARALRARQRNWVAYAAAHHRRTRLIQDRLPHVSAKPLAFPAPAPAAPLGSWMLLARDTLLAAPRCTSPFPHGEARFVEDRAAPPSRAYLKLWEVFTRLGVRPAPGARCLDLGASPGGWTWVLAGLGCRVIAVDRAPLDPRVAALPGVEARQASAFALTPAAVGPID